MHFTARLLLLPHIGRLQVTPGQISQYIGMYVDMKTNHGDYCRVQINNVNINSGDADFGAVTFTQFINGMPYQQHTHINNINVITQAGFLPECSSQGQQTGGGTQPIPPYCKKWGWWHHPECHKYHHHHH